MEYCAYGDLNSYIKSKYSLTNPMPSKEVELIFGQLICAIFHVHQKKLAHRDFKAENVLVKQIEPFIWLKLCDFGCSRRDNKMMVTQVVGTPITNHPNIAKGSYSSSTELYSLGIIIYNVLYTIHPFNDCQDELSIIAKARKGKFDYPEMNEEYIPFIELTKGLMELGKIDFSKVKQQELNEEYWKQCWNNPITQRCVNAVQKVFQKHVPRLKFN